MAARRSDRGRTDVGTYTLLIALDEPAAIEVGALGEVDFQRGHYAYTGSAFGPGGFARIDRHRELAGGEQTVRHWHVDFLLGHPSTCIDSVWVSPGDDRECAIARDLPGEQVPGFGASDCDCPAHLVACGDRSALAEALAEQHDRQHPGPGE